MTEFTDFNSSGHAAFVVTQPLSSDKGMAEDYGTPEAGQLSGAGPKVLERQRVAK